ncbi:MAG: TonB-dependent receptor, plug [Bryobacterales bacterium]|jgi:hypothetical protein|nr:TonB-dependent receptor, plug [Bryobacterales bacterium]
MHIGKSPRLLAANALLISLSLLLVPSTSAQTSTGSATLVGTITDTSGAVVPGAKVMALNVGKEGLSETVSSADGAYYVPNLTPGTYRITFEANGFKTLVAMASSCVWARSRASTRRSKSVTSPSR